MTDLTEKTLAAERKYTGNTIGVDLLDIEMPDGRRAKREVVRHGNARRLWPQDRDLCMPRHDDFAGFRGVLPEVRKASPALRDLSELSELVLLLAGRRRLRNRQELCV